MPFSTVRPHPSSPTHPPSDPTDTTVWFEAFPLVYIDIYHFTLGESGLPFLGLMVGCILASIGYIAWNYYYVEPKFKRTGKMVPEERIGVALVASGFIPASLFIFGAYISYFGMKSEGLIIVFALRLDSESRRTVDCADDRCRTLCPRPIPPLPIRPCLSPALIPVIRRLCPRG
jgi:hypothetical protein